MPENASWREGVAEQVPEVLALMLPLTHCVPLDSLSLSGSEPPSAKCGCCLPIPPKSCEGK